MKKILIICLLLNSVFLTGCWDMREINQIGFVMAVGVDKADDSDNFIVTIQIANPKPVAATKEKAAAAEPIWVLSGEGKTIFEAVRELSQVSSKRIMWAHNYIVIIGESLAKDNIAPVIDFFTHNPELRMKTEVVVSKGKAKDYVGSKTGMEDIAGASLVETIGYEKLTGETVKGSMLKLSQDYLSQYKQPLLSTISFKKEKVMPSESKSDKEVETVQIAGSAVFEKGKMVGMLSPVETRGFAWVLKNTKDTVVTVTESKEDKTNVSVETKNIKSKITTQIKNGEPSITIEISGTGEIAEEDGTTDLPMDKFKKKIESLVNNRIVEDIKTSLNIVQKEFKVDAFSFANNFHAQNKKDWDDGLGKNWENIYPNVPITVSADIKIISSTLNQIPAKKPKREGELNTGESKHK